MTVALDRSAEDARPWIEAARPTHPSLIDTRHVVADLYHVVNVPTILWIDERGRIVRPNDVAFGADTFRHLTGLDASIHLGNLRAWVRGERPAFTAAETRDRLSLPTPDDQEARAEFSLGRWLWERGRAAAAVRHFERGGSLAPHQFTIRRGTMRLRDLDPFGPEFRTMMAEWVGGGRSYYQPLPDTAGRERSESP